MLHLFAVHHGYQWNIFRTMTIICGLFLLRSGQFLDPDSGQIPSKKLKVLSQSVTEAIDGICASVPFFLSNGNLKSFQSFPFRDYRSVKTLHFLLLVWPLYVALQVPFVPESKLEWMRNMLLDLGIQGCIPKASAFVSYVASWPSRTWADSLNRLCWMKRASLILILLRHFYCWTSDSSSHQARTDGWATGHEINTKRFQRVDELFTNARLEASLPRCTFNSLAVRTIARFGLTSSIIPPN